MVAVVNIVKGFIPPDYVAGHFYSGPAERTVTTTFPATATRIYYSPIFIWQTHAFQGFVTRNAGTGDNGKKIRMGLYTHGATNGPTTLVKAATEVTLNGAAADRVTADSFTCTPGWYWKAWQSDTAPSMQGTISIGYAQTAAGDIGTSYFGELFGRLTASEETNIPMSLFYVDTTYAAMASTAVVPTAALAQGPWFGLKA